MRLHDHATNQPRTVANNFQIALLDTVPGVSSFAFTIFNDIFDNCRFIIDNTLSIMKLAGQTIYTYIYIYISLVRSIHRIFEIVHSRVERVHTYRSFTRKKKQLPIINRFNERSIRTIFFFFQRNIRSLTFTHFPNLAHSKIEPGIFPHIYLERRRTIRNKFRISHFCAESRA